MDYLIVVMVPAHPLPGAAFAMESAFAAHVRMLREKLAGHFDRLVIAAPTCSPDWYEANRAMLAEVREAEGICLVPLFPLAANGLEFWTEHAWKAFRSIWSSAQLAGMIHQGFLYDLKRPIGTFSLLSTCLQGKPSIYVVDIDHRHSARMLFEAGLWSRGTYLLNRYVYDPIRFAQVHLAVRWGATCLLKGRELVADFGKGAPRVHDFYDTAHSAEHVLGPARLEQKLARLDEPGHPLRLVYFGRLVRNKGCDRGVRALRLALDRGGRPLELDLIGAGEQKAELEALVVELGLERAVRLVAPVPFGPPLFEKLFHYDLSLATPLIEDTPRSAFDSMAAGIPLVAFDRPYFRELSAAGVAVTSPWPSESALAEQIVGLDRDRARIRQLARRCVSFALENTQEIWLERRVAWTLEALAARESRQEAPGLTRGGASASR